MSEIEEVICEDCGKQQYPKGVLWIVHRYYQGQYCSCYVTIGPNAGKNEICNHEIQIGTEAKGYTDSSDCVYIGKPADHNTMKVNIPEESDWACFLYGSKSRYYIPLKGEVPNWFIRWIMGIFLNCKWVKIKEDK